jgi:tetratricopeptide (TPR) repeat protein
MRVRYLGIAAALAFAASAATAQTAAEHIATGDQLHSELKPAEALVHYEEAVKSDSTNYEALWKASREAEDIAEFDSDKAKGNALYKQAEGWARRAVALKPDDAEGHFYLARAIGKVALTLGSSDKVKYAKVVRDEALAALKANPKHPGALHVMGVWNAEVMRLNGFSRFMAKNFLGGKIFNEASWDNATRYMEQSVEVDPTRLTHHLDLAAIYRDRGETEKARAQYQAVLDGKELDFNDHFYKRIAAEQIKKM